MKFSRGAGGVVLSIGVLSLAASCSQEEERTEVDGAVEATAEALSSGDFSDLALSEGSVQTLGDAAENLHEPFGGLTPEVQVGGIEVIEPAEDSVRSPTAEATFDHIWDLEEIGVDDEEWTYTTTGSYTYDEEIDTWLLEGATQLIMPGYAGYEPISISTTTPDRGRIMDGTGRSIVHNRDVVRIGIDKTQLDSEEDQAAAARELAGAVGIDPDAYEQRVDSYGEQAWVEAITVRTDGGHVTAAEVETIPGVHLIYDQMPLAERSDFAPNLLGRVGEVTAEHLEDDPTLNPGDMIGLSGIQAVHEDTLRGSPGMRITMGETELYSAAPQDGEDVHTGLLPRVQDLAQDIVDDQEVTAAIVAIQPSTGAILAAASHNPDTPSVDTATQSTYAPGSTFKVVSGLAMLRNGLSPSSTVQCPNSVTVHGQQFQNVVGYDSQYLGSIPFSTAMAVSCNTTFVAAYDDVTSAELAQAAADLGMDNEVGVGIYAIKAQVSEDAELNLHASNLFGQGTVETSTLGMAAVSASIADGRTVHPWLVEREDHPQEGGLTVEEAEDLRQLLRGTIEHGTLSFLDPIPGPHVYAKTGTAEAGGDDPHTWVIGSQGDLAVAIFLEEGEWGSTDNGPLLRQFLIEAREILQEYEDE
ncbi:penicillin-binding transpeptidase domain-containing protein [Nesterenkonia ebinurensis]|uniref:penicillin-binding transpeptidase domain-containing protein n=1 Tax=Nesterenkonia ebinurensis TaxID=2608252 RepID=UPI00123D255E|nr:penicillin-binding transpeptidase domain-containing protein [Nesterenkonia ebinurensis]